uniref:D.virilis Ulysses retrotransposon n=1 Tax=Drosophila virilis TaxID=7244 RepID=V9H0U9_DROVI|nr:hypothetical protein 1 - fruit fly (Drosophila virilis) retrotransposon Ulysses [Drosophila virilis]CAA39966.1 unnamed protein product [Drosophila virilis]
MGRRSATAEPSWRAGANANEFPGSLMRETDPCKGGSPGRLGGKNWRNSLDLHGTWSSQKPRKTQCSNPAANAAIAQAHQRISACSAIWHQRVHPRGDASWLHGNDEGHPLMCLGRQGAKPAETNTAPKPPRTCRAGTANRRHPERTEVFQREHSTTVPPKPRRQAHRAEYSSSSPVYVADAQSRNWRNPNNRHFRVEDRRADDFQPEEAYANVRETAYMKLERWNVKFDGEDAMNSVEDFVFRLEFLQRQYQCPWKEVLRGFHLLLTGRAREWYWMHVRHSRVDSWMQLRHALLDRFRGYQTEHEVMQELLQREQQASEGVDDYIHHMRQLAARFQKPLRDRELVRIIKRGLKESLAKYIYAMDVLTVDELRQECLEVERHMGRRSRTGYLQPSRCPQGTRPVVHEVEVPPHLTETPPGELEEAFVRTRNSSELYAGTRDSSTTSLETACPRSGKYSAIGVESRTRSARSVKTVRETPEGAR